MTYLCIIVPIILIMLAVIFYPKFMSWLFGNGSPRL